MQQRQGAFLDIRMLDLSGCEAAASAQISPGTQVAFVPACDQYAIDAFERGAIAAQAHRRGVPGRAVLRLQAHPAF